MRRRWQPADTVIAVAIVLLVGVFGIFGFLAWQAYNSSASQAEERARAAADILAENSRWILGSSRAFLDLLAADIAGRPANVTGETTADVEAAVAILPAEMELAVFDAAGESIAAATSPRLPSNVADTGFFPPLADGQEWIVSRQLQDLESGEPIFLIARRLESGGAFAGIAALVIDASLLPTIWRLLDLGEDSTVTLVRDDGWLIARYPALPEALNVSNQPSYQAAMLEGRGTLSSDRSPADGIARVIAFQRLPDLGIIAYAAVSQDAIQAAIWQATGTVLSLMAPIAIALLIGSFFAAGLLRDSQRTQHALEVALARNQVLFREIHHRVKNNLQTVASMLNLQPISPDIKRQMNHRIGAMSALHEQIYRSGDFARVEVKDYLQAIVDRIRSSQESKVGLVADIEPMTVGKDAATPLGLLVNEVVTNAFKHGFPEGRAGTVRVTLKKLPDNQAELTVEDDGVGFAGPKSSQGIGMRLVDALTAQLGGTSSFSGEGGSKFVLNFPNPN